LYIQNRFVSSQLRFSDDVFYLYKSIITFKINYFMDVYFIEMIIIYVLWVGFILLILGIYSKLCEYVYFSFYIWYFWNITMIIHWSIFLSLFSIIYRIFLYGGLWWIDNYLTGYIDILKLLISNNEDFVLLITYFIYINFLILFINLLLIYIYKEGSWLRRLLFGRN